MFINVLNTCKRFDGNCNTFPAGRLSFTVDNTFLILVLKCPILCDPPLPGIELRDI